MPTTLNPTHEIEVFFDGGCPLCRRETEILRRRDRLGRIRFTDIDATDFSAAAVGKTQEELMAKMHARLTTGEWLQGVEVFRRLYALIGFGPLVFLSRLPLIAQSLDLAYGIFARNRPRIAGRCTDAACTVGLQQPLSEVSQGQAEPSQPAAATNDQEETNAAVS